MHFILVKTRKFLPPKDNIYDLLDHHLPPLEEGDVLFVTSKIAAIHQGRCVKITARTDKDKLAQQEAQAYLPRHKTPRGLAMLTITNHALMPSAGIDSSSGRGHYILPPKKPENEAQKICWYLKKKYKLKNLAVIIPDSHSIPLRLGTVGISLGFYGLEPLLDYSGQETVFGARLKKSRVNIADSLSPLAVLLMGEAGEQTPLVILRNCKLIKFTDKPTFKKLVVDLNQDIYFPLLKVFQRGKNLTKKQK